MNWKLVSWKNFGIFLVAQALGYFVTAGVFPEGGMAAHVVAALLLVLGQASATTLVGKTNGNGPSLPPKR